jgi:hypothetical protein
MGALAFHDMATVNLNSAKTPPRHREFIALCAVLLTVWSSLLQAAPPNAEITYVSQFGGLGNDGPAGTFFHPVGIDMDSEKNLIITEWGNSRIQRCTYEGDCEIIVSDMDFQPTDLAVDSQDRMLLSGWPDHHEITLCTPDGQCPSAFGTFGGEEPGQFIDPADIVIDSRGRIIIADRQNERIQICDYEGNCTAFGTFNSGPEAVPGEFWEPKGLLLDGTGRLFVGETGDEVVSVCNVSGACVARMGELGTGNGQFKTPGSLGITSRGDLVVFEASNHRLQLCDISDYDIAGDCIIFGEFGDLDGQFRFPKGFVDEQDRIIITDEDNHRIQILQITYLDGPGDFQINAGLNDAWFSPTTAGQGFFITVFEDIGMMFLAWFTYDSVRPDENVDDGLGDAGHRWLTAFGPYDGNRAELKIELTSGGVFDSGEPMTEQDIDGTMSVEFEGCNVGKVIYEISSAGLSGLVPIKRIALDNVPRCEAQGTQ